MDDDALVHGIWRRRIGAVIGAGSDIAVLDFFSPQELAECFDLDHALRHVDAVFERVLGK